MPVKPVKSIQKAYHTLVPAPARNWLYQSMPGTVKNKLNKLDQQIKALPPAARELQLPKEPLGPSRFSRRINKLCGEEDWRDEEWLCLFDALGESHVRHKKHRKAWEWVQGIYALQQLNLLHDEATGLGVGAGVESVLYYLANQIKLVILSIMKHRRIC
jgi:hypothetical protein